MFSRFESVRLRRAWRGELLRAVFYPIAGAAVGALFGAPTAGALLATLLYASVRLRRVYVLARWLEHPKRTDLPDPGGIWSEIYQGLIDLQKRNRKRKKRLSAILAEFRASTEALTDGAVVLGSAGEIVWFNVAAQGLLGLRTSQDVGQRIPNLLRHPEFTAFFERGNFEKDVEVPSPVNEAVTLAVRIIPYGEGQRLLIARDISELKRVETMRRDFVANASHELRTPLTVLRGYLDMMEPESKGEGALAAWHAPLAEMRAQAARMEALIADMLKLARLESDASQVHQEVIEVPRMLDALLEEIRAASDGEHRIEAEIERDLRLFGRELEAHSIFANLLFNAVRYTPSGGTIRVRWWGDEAGAHFRVEDTGIGIPEEDIPRLTERFYRVDVARSRARGGTGLGLAIVKHALDRHEGVLAIESRLGAGSTFTCHFPPHRVQRERPLAANE